MPTRLSSRSPYHRRTAPFVYAVALAVASVVGLGAPAGHATGARTRAALTTPATGYVAVAPVRVLDTRTSTTVHALGPGRTASLRLAGVAAVPASGVAAVAVNVTGIAHSGSSYLTVYPGGTTRPPTSNLNLTAGFPRANQVITALGPNGTIAIFNSGGTTDVLVDVTGYFRNGSSYTPHTPTRILDTRTTGSRRPVAAGKTTALSLAGRGGVPASGASAVVLNLTGISTKASSYLTVYSSDSAQRPNTSNLNVAAGQTAGVLVMAPVGADGTVDIFNSGGPTHLVVDVQGWFTGTGDYRPVTPLRIMDTDADIAVPTYGLDMAVGQSQDDSTIGALVFSITIVKPTHAGYATVHPGDTALPATSNVNSNPGAIVANLAIVQMSSNDNYMLYNHALGADVLIDLVGVIHTNHALAVPTRTMARGELTQPYADALPPVEGLPPYQVAVSAGHLPPGLSLTPGTGELTGTPTAAGDYPVTLRATDSSGEAATESVTFTVHPFASKALWGWGSTVSLGLLGDGVAPATISTVPVPISGATDIRSAAIDQKNGYALTSSGTVLAWGDGSGGGLGNGVVAGSSSTPTAVSGLTGVTQIATTGGTAYALKSDGTVWAWGAGVLGQLGNGGTAVSGVPVAVSGLTGVTQIAAGRDTGYAVMADGSVQAWGGGKWGQLGNGSTATTALTPVPVSGLSGVTELAGGQLTAYAVKSDGTVWAWGYGGNGALGKAVSMSTTPIQVAGLTGISHVGAGPMTGYAVKSDGSAWAWGDGSQGRLGNGQDSQSLTPVQVGSLTGVQQVVGNQWDAYAVTADGSLWSWGFHEIGLTGDGRDDVTEQETPERVLAPPVTSLAPGAMAVTALAVGVS